MSILKKEIKKQEKAYTVVVVFNDGSERREYLDASCISISEGCLIVVDPLDYVPCEVHCYPLTSVKSFIFDVEAVKDGKTNFKEIENNGTESKG